MAELWHVKVFCFLIKNYQNWKICIYKKKSYFKNQIFWTIPFEKLKISFLLFVWMLKEPISTKKLKILKILHPHARPLCALLNNEANLELSGIILCCLNCCVNHTKQTKFQSQRPHDVETPVPSISSTEVQQHRDIQYLDVWPPWVISPFKEKC
jgi:hypothetical protein